MPCAATVLCVTGTASGLPKRVLSTHLKLPVKVLPHPRIPRTRTDGCQHLRLPKGDDARAVSGASKFARLKRNVGVADTHFLPDAATCIPKDIHQHI